MIASGPHAYPKRHPVIENDFEKIYEASINGTYEYEDGTKSGRALATDEHEGIRDITNNPDGQGKGEVDKTGVYLGVPCGRYQDKTAWVNPVKAEDISPSNGKKARLFQKALRNAPKEERQSMEDWSPESPDMSYENGKVIDNVNDKVMDTEKPSSSKPKVEPKKPESLVDKFWNSIKSQLK